MRPISGAFCARDCVVQHLNNNIKESDFDSKRLQKREEKRREEAKKCLSSLSKKVYHIRPMIVLPAKFTQFSDTKSGRPEEEDERIFRNVFLATQLTSRCVLHIFFDTNLRKKEEEKKNKLINECLKEFRERSTRATVHHCSRLVELSQFKLD